MRVLIACEFSATVREAFRRRGHDAVSCDLLPSDVSGPHIKGDVLAHLNDGWDLMIAHPPCTHLSVSGARHFAKKSVLQKQALDFVLLLLEAPIKHIALENPVSIISSRLRPPDQIIQPWQFGHEAQKTTCLWLKNLPLLVPTSIVGKGEFVIFKSGKKHPKWYSDAKSLTEKECKTLRSRTFQGIAEAMADQWGKEKLNGYQVGLFG